MGRSGRHPRVANWKRKIAIVALVGVMGATVSGETRAFDDSTLTTSFSTFFGARSLAHLAQAWSASASSAVSFGILYGTVLSKMNPEVRQSIVSAVEGLREICTGRPAKPLVLKCSAPSCPRKAARCARA